MKLIGQIVFWVLFLLWVVVNWWGVGLIFNQDDQAIILEYQAGKEVAKPWRDG